MSNSVTEHVKKVCKQNDELYTLLNKVEREMRNLIDKNQKLEVYIDSLQKEVNELQDETRPTKSTENIATINDLNELITDLQSSFELVLNQTPRNSSDIADIKDEIKTLKNALNSLQTIVSSTLEKPILGNAHQTVETVQIMKDETLPTKVKKLSLPKEKHKDLVLKKAN